MTEEPADYAWGVFSASVRGAQHKRNGLPNQDAVRRYPSRPEKYGPPLVLVLSDGHGSAKSFRSDRGSKIAVIEIKNTIRLLLKSEIVFSDSSIIKRQLENDQLPRELIRIWRKAVDKHLSDNPFTKVEFARLQEKEGELACNKVRENPYLAYGSTLLVVLIFNTFIHLLQLGDGDILIVSDNGEVSRPLIKDERLIANETTSLSQPDAWKEFRSEFIRLAGSPPALILVSSDGYSNSFRDEDSFLKVGSDILEMMRTEGPDKVRCSMSDWLRDASQLGSGDDISLGVIYRKDIVKPITKTDNCLDVSLEVN